jgi:hypothetical protein
MSATNSPDRKTTGPIVIEIASPRVNPSIRSVSGKAARLLLRAEGFHRERVNQAGIPAAEVIPGEFDLGAGEAYPQAAHLGASGLLSGTRNSDRQRQEESAASASPR